MDHPVMNNDTSSEIGGLTRQLPVIDFLTQYLPPNPITKERQFSSSQDRQITPEVAEQYLPIFMELAEEYEAEPEVATKSMNASFSLEPADVGYIILALYAAKLAA